MKGKPSYKVMAVVVMCMVIVALVLPACAAPAAKAPTTTTSQAEQVWEIPAITDITGPLASAAIGYYAGIEDWVNTVNDKGGVNGVKVKMTWLDTQSSLDRSVNYFNRIVSQKKKPPVLIGWQSQVQDALKPRIDENKIVLVTGGLSVGQFAVPGYIFANMGDFASDAGTTVKWLKEVYFPKWKPEEAKKRNLRIGAITFDNSFGKGWMTPEVLAYYKSIGVDFVGADFVPWGLVDASVQVTSMAKKEPDIIVGNVYTSQLSIILKEATRQGLKTPGNEKTQWCYVCTGTDSPLFLLNSPEEIDGILQWNPGEQWDSTLAGPTQMRKVFADSKRAPTMKMWGYLAGISLYKLAESGMMMAMEKKPFDEITGEDIYNAFISGKKISMDGFTPDCTFSPTIRTGQWVSIGQLDAKNKTITKISEYQPNLFLLPGGKDVPK